MATTGLSSTLLGIESEITTTLTTETTPVVLAFMKPDIGTVVPTVVWYVFLRYHVVLFFDEDIRES